MELIDEIKKALENATSGPWFAIRTEVFIENGPICKLWGQGSKGAFSFDNYENNALLISNAPTWLNSLIALVEQKDTLIQSQKAELQNAAEAISELMSECPNELTTYSERIAWFETGSNRIAEINKFLKGITHEK